MNKLTIRLRLTLLSTVVLTLITISLTLVLNQRTYSALQVMDASPLFPSQPQSGEVPMVPHQSIASVKRDYQFSSLMIMAAFIAGGSILTYYVSGKALKPLDELNESILKVKTQNLDKMLPVPGTNDEISDLTTSFNQMMDTLNQGFLRQERFSANAAHELRTPLAIMQSQMDVFNLQKNHPIADYEELVFDIQKQTTRLQVISNHLLDLTLDGIHLEMIDFDIEDLILDVCDHLQSKANEKSITFAMDVKTMQVNGNLDLLYQVMFNLLDNAINYTPHDATIVIKTQLYNNEKRLTITNPNETLSTNDIDHLTDPFYRADPSRTQSPAGSGLGLSLVKHSIAMHQGEMSLQYKDNYFKVQIKF